MWCVNNVNRELIRKRNHKYVYLVGRPSKMLDDKGVHFTDEGVKFITKVINDKIDQWRDAARERRDRRA